MNKKLIAPIVTATAMLATSIGSTFALFNSRAESNISINSGRVEISTKLANLSIYSASLTDDDETGVVITGSHDLGEFSADYYYVKQTEKFINGGTAIMDEEGALLKLSNVSPGDKVTLSLNMENSSNININYRVSISSENDDLFEALVFNVNGYDYSGIKSIVMPWESWLPEDPSQKSLDLISITLPLTAGNEWQEKTTTIKFTVDAVQGNAYIKNPTTDENFINEINSLLERKHLDFPTLALDELPSEKKESLLALDNLVWNEKYNLFGINEDGIINYATAKYPVVFDENVWEFSETYLEDGHPIYLTGDTFGGAITISGSLDVGNQTPEEVKYENSGSSKEIVIRTNSYETSLTVNAPKDVIRHYDVCGSVNIIESYTCSYHEYGKVPFVEIAKGRIALEKGAEVEKLHFDATTQQDFDQIIVAADPSVTLPEFSRDEAVIKEKGTLVVELQKDTKNDENTDSDYVWLYKQGVISQIVVSTENIEGIEKDATTGDLKGAIKDSSEFETLQLGVTEKAKETQKAAVEIANNYTGSHGTIQTVGGKENVNVAELDQNGDIKDEDKTASVTEGGLNETDKEVAKLEVVTEAIEKEEAKKAAWLVDNVPFAKLEDAFEYIGKQDEVNIVLQKDITVIYSTEAYITIAKDHKLTVDLNGNNVTVIAKRGDTTAFFKNNGELNLIDSKDTKRDGTQGSIKFIATSPDIDWDVEAQPDDYPGYANNLISNNGILTIDGGKYTNETPYGSNGSSGASYVVDNYAATFILKGGFLDDLTNDVIRLFCNSTTSVDKVVIEGGIIGAENKTARVIWIQIPNGNVNPAELCISGGKINGQISTYSFASGTGGYCTESQANAVNVIVSGGNITNITLFGAKLTISSGTIGKVNNYCSYGGGCLYITNGTFIGTVYCKCDDILISGGTFKTEDYVYCVTADGKYYVKCISGGTFHDTYFKSELMNGFAAKNNDDGSFQVVRAPYIVQYQSSTYSTYVWGGYLTKAEADEQLSYFASNYGKGTSYNAAYYEAIKANYAFVYTYNGADYTEWYFENKEDADDYLTEWVQNNGSSYNARVIEWAND